jgi:hypothetical protein
MEEEINKLLHDPSITNIILQYDVIEEKLNDLEHEIINLTIPSQTNSEKTQTNSEKTQTNSEKENNLNKLKVIIEKITDSYIKDALIEDLIKMYKKISKLCSHD